MARIAKLKKGDFSIAGGLNERLPAVLNGLIAHFPYDGVLKPSITRVPINYVTFNGSNSISIPNPISYQTPSTQNWAVEVLCKISTGVDQRLVNFNSGLYLSSSTTPLLYINSGANDCYDYGTVSITDNKWHHVIFNYQFSTDKIEIYIDGVDTSTTGPRSGTKLGTGLPVTLTIGSGVIGSLSQFRIYKRSLTASEVAERYKNTRELWDILACRYNFDEYPGTVPFDTSWNANLCGILNGATPATSIIQSNAFTSAAGLSIDIPSTQYLNIDTFGFVDYDNGSGDYNPWDSVLPCTDFYNPVLGSPNTMHFYDNSASQGSCPINGCTPTNATFITSAYIKVLRGDYQKVCIGSKIIYSDATVSDHVWDVPAIYPAPEYGDNTYKYVLTTIPTGGKTVTGLYPAISHSDTVETDLLVYFIQVESDSLASSPMFSSRTALPYLKYDNTNEVLASLAGGGSIAFKFKYSVFLTYGVFFRLRSAPFAEAFFNVSKLITWRPYSESDNLSFTTTKNIGDTAYYLFTWDASGNCCIYEDGILKASKNTVVGKSGTYSTSIAVGGDGGTTYASNGVLSDLSFYNRPLTSTEAKRFTIGRTGMSLSEQGSISRKILVERPNNLPSNIYHFPLCFNGKDVCQRISPATAANVIFGDEGAFIGTSVTNLLSNPDFSSGDFSNWTQYVGGDGVHSIVFDNPSGSFSCDIRCTSGSNNMKYQTLTTSTQGTYTLSGDIKLISYTSGVIGITLYIDYTDATSNHTDCIIDTTKLNDWQHLSVSVTTNAAKTVSSVTAYGPWSNNLVGNFRGTNFLLENKPFAVPFAASTRAASLLTYNLNSSIGLNWNGDWSLVYFKKPISTQNNLLTDYNIESLGCSSNSVGGGYFYLGKITAQDGLVTLLSGLTGATGGTITPSAAISPSYYFNNWHMISIVKSGSTLKAQFFGLNAYRSATYTSIGTVPANVFVNQYGYDLIIGGFSNASPPNSYYRDLIVAKRAFTDAELLGIFNRFMSDKDRILQVQGKLTEGDTL